VSFQTVGVLLSFGQLSDWVLHRRGMYHLDYYHMRVHGTMHEHLLKLHIVAGCVRGMHVVSIPDVSIGDDLSHNKRHLAGNVQINSDRL
jgi:hypothetical protein